MIYDNIQLTQEELEAAILEGRKKKWFKEANQAYWQREEEKAIARKEEANRIEREKRKK